MSDWNPSHYLKYGDERTRPAADLAARIPLESPATIADLGCGPGNSTQILRQRWPNARIVGIDHSAEMLETARRAFPDGNWVRADVAAWIPDRPFDLLYANAALQWIPDHRSLIRHLISSVAAGGVLAFQIPSGTFATVRQLIHDVSRDAAWDDRLAAARAALTMESPSFYYDVLVPQATRLDIWETEYAHVMENPQSIVDWMSSTGLRPFLAALAGDTERQAFLRELQHRVDGAYPLRADGKVLFPFRRTFVIACR